MSSNSPAIVNTIPASHRVSEQHEFDRSTDGKVLGLLWSKSIDEIKFNVSPPSDRCSKRAILSTVARLWDLMGFVAPVVLYAKLLIKELWLLKIDWDDIPPRHVCDIWKQFCSELPLLNEFKIPRFLGVVQNGVVRLLGFADASERAYGADVYMHVIVDDNITVRLVCEKSKVAPVKRMSIARLELCAAELLSRLFRRVHDTFNSRYNITALYAFTDSKVTLCWLNSAPHIWQTFVANRVVKTIENILTYFDENYNKKHPIVLPRHDSTVISNIDYYHRKYFHVGPELSSASFLAALKRFLLRREPVKCMYTDNATYLVGARSYLRELYKFIK